MIQEDGFHKCTLFSPTVSMTAEKIYLMTGVTGWIPSAYLIGKTPQYQLLSSRINIPGDIVKQDIHGAISFPFLIALVTHTTSGGTYLNGVLFLGMACHYY